MKSLKKLACVMAGIGLLAISKPAHAAGWYLIAPTPTADRGDVNYKAPLWEWYKVATFATEPECEKANRDSYLHAGLELQANLGAAQDSDEVLNVKAGRWAFCIQTDNPLLGKSS